MHRMKRITRQCVPRVTALRLGLLALGTIAAAPALATISQSNMAVSALVTSNRTITAGPLAFGSYDTTATTRRTAQPS